MSDLKLIALDAEDMNVISAHLQDAVLRVADMAYLPEEQRFAVVLNRFDWATLIESAGQGGVLGQQRRRTGLRFERVLSAQVQGLDIKDKSAALALLAVTFKPMEEGASAEGDVTLTFSGGAAIRLRVECLEAEMRDLGAVWSASKTPVHKDVED